MFQQRLVKTSSGFTLKKYGNAVSNSGALLSSSLPKLSGQPPSHQVTSYTCILNLIWGVLVCRSIKCQHFTLTTGLLMHKFVATEAVILKRNWSFWQAENILQQLSHDKNKKPLNLWNKCQSHCIWHLSNCFWPNSSGRHLTFGTSCGRLGHNTNPKVPFF